MLESGSKQASLNDIDFLKVESMEIICPITENYIRRQDGMNNLHCAHVLSQEAVIAKSRRCFVTNHCTPKMCANGHLTAISLPFYFAEDT